MFVSIDVESLMEHAEVHKALQMVQAWYWLQQA